jgi:hypothetical protein
MITNLQQLITDPQELQEQIKAGIQKIKVNLAYNSGFFKGKSIKMIKTIADAVQENKITALTLYCDKIGHKKVKLISEMLKNKTSLTHLIIYFCNKMGENEAKAIGALLENNFTLTQFHLQNPSCSDNLVTGGIVRALTTNTTLLNLYLDTCDVSIYNSNSNNNLAIIKKYLNRNRNDQYDFIEKKIKLSEGQQNTDLLLIYEDIQNDLERLPEDFLRRDELYLIYIKLLVNKYQRSGNFENTLHCLYDAMDKFPDIQEYKVMLAEIIFALPKPLFPDRLDDYRLICLLMHYISDRSLLGLRETLLKSVERLLKLPNDTKDVPTSESLASLLGGELCTIDQFIERNRPPDQLIFEHVYEVFIKTNTMIYNKPDYNQLDLKKIADDFRASKEALMDKFKRRIILKEVDQKVTINDNKTSATTGDQYQNSETNNDKPSSSANRYRHFNYTSQNKKVETNSTGESFKACK